MFDFNIQITDSRLLKRLKQQWRNYNLHSSNKKFCKYQWNKHGKDSYSLLDQTQYFTRALYLLNNNNILGSLRAFGIIPRTQTTEKDILVALKPGLGVWVRLKCWSHEGSIVIGRHASQKSFSKEWS